MFSHPYRLKYMNDLTFRHAERADVPALVQMMRDDPLGAQREIYSEPLPDAYYAAFAAIDSNDQNELIVVEREGALIGTMQLTFIPYLSHMGSWRCLVESVRIAAAWRGQGIGAQLMEWAINRARERGCAIVQLTTHASRTDAHRFYERLGFKPSHVGMKLDLRS